MLAAPSSALVPVGGYCLDDPTYTTAYSPYGGVLGGSTAYPSYGYSAPAASYVSPLSYGGYASSYQPTNYATSYNVPSLYPGASTYTSPIASPLTTAQTLDAADGRMDGRYFGSPIVTGASGYGYPNYSSYYGGSTLPSYGLTSPSYSPLTYPTSTYSSTLPAYTSPLTYPASTYASPAYTYPATTLPSYSPPVTTLADPYPYSSYPSYGSCPSYSSPVSYGSFPSAFISGAPTRPTRPSGKTHIYADPHSKYTQPDGSIGWHRGWKNW